MSDCNEKVRQTEQGQRLALQDSSEVRFVRHGKQILFFKPRLPGLGNQFQLNNFVVKRKESGDAKSSSQEVTGVGPLGSASDEHVEEREKVLPARAVDPAESGGSRGGASRAVTDARLACRLRVHPGPGAHRRRRALRYCACPRELLCSLRRNVR